MDSVGSRIKELRRQNGYTVDDISKKFQISKSTIYNYENNHREMSYEVLINFANFYNVPIDYIIQGNKEENNKLVSTSLKLSIIGKIPAGTPIEAITVFDGHVYIPETIHEKYGNDLFALRVKGDSMSRVVPNNSIAIIKKQCSVENGEVAVILVDHKDATLKRFFRLDDETVVLKPDSYSDDYEPELINLKNETVAILGKMIWYCSDDY